MKINWDTVITVIATFAAEFGGAYWLLKRARATENPTQKPPSRLTGIIGTAKYLIKTYWVPAVGLALPPLGILWELSRPGPADDVSIFFIVLFTVALSFHLSVLVSIRHYEELSARTFDLMSLVRGLQDLGEHQVGVNKMVLDLQQQIIELRKTQLPEKLEP